MSLEAPEAVSASAVVPQVRAGGPSVPLTAAFPTKGAKVYRFVAMWAGGWALIGASVAAGIAFGRGQVGELLPLAVSSVLFAEVVGFTALTSARLVFPYYARLILPLRLALQTLTLIAGTALGSIAILAAQPLYSLANLRLVSMIVAINAVLGVLVGTALHTYDSMRRQIEAQYRQIREKEALEREVSIAREVQRELLPRSVPLVRGLELAGICLPAVGVGGDYYDFLPLPDERIGLVIADVSGKGIPAALLMAGLQASVRSLALPGVSPCEINFRLNEMLHRSTSASRYATLFFAFYDPESRQLVYSNAGHYPPLHLGASGATRLSHGGLPIGLLGESRYGEGCRTLGVGDLVALFTDGVIETPNARDEEFGEARLIEILERHRGHDLQEILGTVVDEVARWSGGGPPHDDITLVLARAS